MIVIFVQFIDQLIDYPINCASLNKCIRMGITAFKCVIWGGKSTFLWSQITFYGSTDASP